MPDGLEVERLAIAMCAGLGLVWAKISDEAAKNFRIAAHCALLHLGADGRAKGVDHLTRLLEDAALFNRATARVLDDEKGPEETIRRLHQAAHNIETVGRVLGVLDAGEPQEEAV